MGMLNNQAEPTINHMSHSHPLNLINYNPNLTLAPSSCAGCRIPLTQGLTYNCKLCNYYLHIKCSQMPQKIKHPFDQSHVLTLVPTPLYPEGVFRCDACGEKGNGFSYSCGECAIDLHILCASMPLTVNNHSHHHSLNLVFLPPYLNKSFSCDVCKEVGGKHWLYNCSLCGFDAHLSCGTSKVLPAQGQGTVHMNQYQQTPSFSVPVVVQPNPAQAYTQQSMPGYGPPGGGSPVPGISKYTNQHSLPNYAYAGVQGQGPYNPSVNTAFHRNQSMPNNPGMQHNQGQMYGRGDAGGNVNAQLLQAIPSANNGGNAGNVNAQLLQEILSANNGGGDPNSQLIQSFLNGNGGGGGGFDLSSLMGGGGGGGLDLSSLLGGGGGGGLDLSSLMGGGGGLDLSSLMGGGFDISSLTGLMGGFGLG